MKSTTQRIEVQFDGKKQGGRGTVTAGGKTLNCIGLYGYNYPEDSTINTSDKELSHWSKEHSCELPYAIKLDGTKGIFFHQDVTTYDMSHDNTHGCINLSENDAKWLYNWVQGRTRVLISYPW